MPVFFVPPECISQEAISVTGDILVHLRDSLRIRVGEIVLFGDGVSRHYRTEITAITKQRLTGRIIEIIIQPAPMAPFLILGQALLKGEKMDWVIQKATELGATRIVPLASERATRYHTPPLMTSPSGSRTRVTIRSGLVYSISTRSAR